MNILHVCIPMYYVCAWYLKNPIDVGELHFGPWKLNLGSLEKQLVNH